MMQIIKRLGILVCCGLAAAPVFAQTGEQYFVYIQNEERTPFYVKANDSLLSGSPAGYIIVPELKEGKNTLVIGFPKNEYPEERFTVRLGDHQDQGYLLKKSGKRSFVLYNLHDFSVLHPAGTRDADVLAAAAPAPAVSSSAAPASAAPVPRAVMPPPEAEETVAATDTQSVNTPPVTASDEQAPTDTLPPADNQPLAANKPKPASDPFAKMLNAVTGTGTEPSAPPQVQAAPQTDTANTMAVSAAGDSGKTAPERQAGEADQDAAVAVLPPDEHREQEEAVPPALPVAPPEQPAIGNADEVADPFAGEAAGEQENNKNGRVEKRRRKKERRAAEEPQFITFLTGDTAAVSTPPQEETESAEASDSLSKKERRRQRKEARAEERQEEEAAAALPAAAEAAPPVSGINTEAGNAGVQEESGSEMKMINSDCKQVADEDEFQKVRRKMASQHTEEGMLRVAVRYLDKECFTTAQLQSLVYLFMSDEYRYKFLDRAYPHVTDTDQFSRLEKVLGEEYYKGRFRAMVK